MFFFLHILCCTYFYFLFMCLDFAVLFFYSSVLHGGFGSAIIVLMGVVRTGTEVVYL